MLIYKSILPMALLLGISVTSADLIIQRRVPRRHTQFTRSHNSNHPPFPDFLENAPEKAPVAVMADEDSILHMKKVAVNEISDTSETRSTENHQPGDLMLLGIVQDYEDRIIQKPKARSVDIKRSELDETKTPALADYDNKPRRKIRRRLQQVRKVKVNKSQLDVFVNETEAEAAKVTTKETTKETTAKPEEAYKEEQQSYATQTFKRRKGMRPPVVPIIESQNYVFSHSGNFHYSYEGGDGTKAYERGQLKESNGGAGNAVEGNYSYKDNDGNDYSLQYTADENGYRPVGAHLPTPPPIPPAIKRALEYLATKTTESEEVTEKMWTRH
ncbi:uncharacterized protein LOC118282341 [Spodoptera frugiperda]|uniref:Uncharacterized protein LOC118282341 n=1 Tax=Spodoptera frugiperda TaxID=7108 RepID=A0A9R0ETM8_SPOFR|nr:uncharacterized protein LOC118282341 [Spodoptera frugiperda]